MKKIPINRLFTKMSLERRLSIRAPILPRGTSDFAEMRISRKGVPLTIADKTRFLPDLVDAEAKALVFTRPIRFGKSSILSMLEKFLSIQDRESNLALFNNLDINKDDYAAFRAKYQGQFPVIHLTLENINAPTWSEARHGLSETITELYEKHSYVLESLNKRQTTKYHKIINNEAGDYDLKRSLADLATYLSIHHKKKVIILIDEYDTPIHNAYKGTKKKELNKNGSYFKRMNEFMMSFFRQALKGHKGVEKGFMTGVLRTAFSSLLSSLNNTSVYSVLSPGFAEVFGLTEAEVEYFISQIEGLDENEVTEVRKSIRQWYNGYYIGNNMDRMYNPWSVSNFFCSLSSTGSSAASSYWLQVGNSLEVYENLALRFERIKTKLEDLMQGKTITVKLNERTILSDLDNPYNDSAFWGLLLHAGYLGTPSAKLDWDDVYTCEIAIPNYEVRGAYASFIKRYLEERLLASGDGLNNYNGMLQALLDNDIDKFAEYLQTYMEQVVSFYDIPKKTTDKIPEQVYHAFFIGLLGGLHSANFQVSSNRESGLGRYDIALIPTQPNQHGMIFEFKSTDDSNNVAKEANNALKQIKEKRYAAELKKNGAISGVYIGIGFCGKYFHIEHTVENYSSGKELNLDYISYKDSDFPKLISSNSNLFTQKLTPGAAISSSSQANPMPYSGDNGYTK